MKTLILLRGLPGAGKNTFGKLMTNHVVSADDYFDVVWDGVFSSDKLHDAHQWCQNIVENRMRNYWQAIVVANTFTQDWEMKVYLDFAETYKYSVHTIIVENRHGSSSVHDVPQHTIEKMRKRFSVKL
jgi:predicted kinase